MTNQDLAQLAQEVRAARKSRGMTQQQLADKAGISPRSVQMFEKGETNPQPANLRAMLRVLNLDEDGQPAQPSEEGVSAHWRPSTRVAANMLGAYLESLPEEEAIEIAADLTRQIFDARTTNR